MSEAPDPNDHVKHGLETVMAIHARAHQTTRNHLLIERITTEIGQPRTLYLVVALTAGWVVWNSYAHGRGLWCPDPPPFAGLECLVSVIALVLTTTVLTIQNRHARISESRSHLDLQVSLLIEQKIAKLISLTEELRRDLPNVRDRSDPVAEDMKRPVDPGVLVHTIERTLDRLPDVLGTDEDATESQSRDTATDRSDDR